MAPREAARDRSIRTYRARRDFTATAEPASRRARPAGHAPIFVVQKHSARRLHWDFRLEHGGALWSWAVPKGPSLDPDDRRLAVRTEDHPRTYADFAGVIAEGQYGAGTVEIWDRGTWEHTGEQAGKHRADPARSLAAGELKFRLRGSRLAGAFVLIRLKPRAKDQAEHWLLIKERDDATVRGADAAALEQAVARPPGSQTASASSSGTRRAAKSASIPSARRAADGGGPGSVIPLTHADRVLWPGISKRDLADYWLAVAPHALPEIALRPLALVRCPEGVAGAHFFQKHGLPGHPSEIRAGQFGNGPYLVIRDVAGLIACAQISAIELHAWGAREPDVGHPDRIVFDLDPGEGVAFASVARAAREVRARLKTAGLAAFCRTTGGKGLHVVCPVAPVLDWEATRAWCRGFAEAMVAQSPETYVARLPKHERRGKILIDWLRNGLGATAIASFSPRALAGATVATRLAWREVTETLDPMAYTLHTVPQRLKRQRVDPWRGFAEAARPIPQTEGPSNSKGRR